LSGSDYDLSDDKFIFLSENVFKRKYCELSKAFPFGHCFKSLKANPDFQFLVKLVILGSTGSFDCATYMLKCKR
jgi:hypothetical protein